MKDLKRVEVKSRAELREWLKKNHQAEESIWLVTYKKSKPAWHVGYDAIVEEALCFGWIDSLPRRLDQHRTMVRLSPRSPKSAWSQLNRNRVSRLISQGLMARSGLEAVELAKKNGTWELLRAVDHNQVPKDLKAALRKFQGAQSQFDNFPPSSRRAILEWIALAKTPETRAKRVLETARLATKGIRANHYRQPKKSTRG